MMGLPKPVASLHNSWLSQKGGVLAQTLLPGSKKKVQRNSPDEEGLSSTLSPCPPAPPPPRRPPSALTYPLTHGAFSCPLGFWCPEPKCTGFMQAHKLRCLCLGFPSDKFGPHRAVFHSPGRGPFIFQLTPVQSRSVLFSPGL